jgi:GntR family transcriptional regulator, transcriptional repressor for pyruvate dehydrogenase complex
LSVDASREIQDAPGHPDERDLKGEPVALHERPVDAGAEAGRAVRRGGLAQFGEIRIRPAFHDVVGLLIDAIRSGYFRVGDRLPAERDLALELEVSRPVVREAIDVLEAAHICEVKRGRFGGTTLVSLEGIPSVLSSLHGEHLAPLSQYLDVREILVIEACLRAAERATPEDIAALREILAEAEDALDVFDSFVEHTVRYVLLIAIIAHNPTLTEFLRVIVNRMAVVGRRSSIRPTHAFVQEIHAILLALTTAIEDNDQTAMRRLVQEHIKKVRGLFAPDE